MATGIAMMLAALSLLFYNQREAEEADRTAQAALAGVAEVQKEHHAGIITAYYQAPAEPAEEMPVVAVGGNDYVGSLSVPALGLELPVLSVLDYNQLKLSPCRYYGSIVTDNLVVAAHNYITHFGYLGELEQGDEVVYTTMDGYSVPYRVTKVESLPAASIEEMISAGDADLTLFTCTYTGEARVTVRCQRAEPGSQDSRLT
jgi:sortase A